MKKHIDFKVMQNHFKETGFIFPNSDIYGGLANAYDYGPLGTLLIKNLKDLWWREFITKEPNNYGLSAKTLLNPQVWVASGHIDNFLDPLVENQVNQKRYRADHIVEEVAPELNVETMIIKDLEQYLMQNVHQYDGSKAVWGPVRQFNLMFETYQGIVEANKTKLYLRPELAQGIFINYKNILKSMRAKLPFGIGQIGTSFRNEVTPRNFTFRTREFEQMELEYFVKPSESDQAFKYYQAKIKGFLELLGLDKSHFKFREHSVNELAHYAKKTVDVEYKFPFGWGEIIGLANRGDFDLKSHMNASKVNLTYVDEINSEVYLPYVIEPSIGVDRLALALLIDAYQHETIEGKERLVLKLDPQLAPFQIAILPLIKKLHQNTSEEIFKHLIHQGISATYDHSGSIGKRYARQDAIGTVWCLTVDDQTLTKQTVTLRSRDSMAQINVKVHEVINHLKI